LILFGIVAELPSKTYSLGHPAGPAGHRLVVVWASTRHDTCGEPTPGIRPAEHWHRCGVEGELLCRWCAGVAVWRYARSVESAALARLFAFVTQTFINRTSRSAAISAGCSRLRRDDRRVLIILGVAVGSPTTVDAQVPGGLIEWTQARVDSRPCSLLGSPVLLVVLSHGHLLGHVRRRALILPLGHIFGVDP